MERNIFDSIKIGLASPDTIRSWSYGEVKKPETINYRTLKAERDGLFCEKIFGPAKDYECYCGKYKRVRYTGRKCEKCGVEVTSKKVRRERMGHIELAAPVSHIWYFRAIPSRIGTLLDISPRELEKVLYFIKYIVINPGNTPLSQNQLLSDNEYKDYYSKYQDDFEVGMGAEAIKTLLHNLDLDKLSVDLRAQLEGASGQKKAKIIKRLAIVEAFRIEGSKLYATTYTEPGIQKAATPTYVISKEVYQLIDSNPNIVQEAKNELYARYNDTQRNAINNQLENNLQNSDQTLKTKVQESITKTQDERKEYLDALSSGK